jgi:hypothetical protein
VASSSSAGAAAGSSAFDVGKLQRGEFIGFGGAGVLFASLFLPWFSTSENPNATIGGKNGANLDVTAWETYGSLDWLLVAACAAPFILAWIIVRGHTLTWRPGEVTMIVGITAFVLIILNGVVLGRPGEPDSEISFNIGYFVGILGAGGICAGGLIRQAEGDRARKPPGTL